MAYFFSKGAAGIHSGDEREYLRKVSILRTRICNTLLVTSGFRWPGYIFDSLMANEPPWK